MLQAGSVVSAFLSGSPKLPPVPLSPLRLPPPLCSLLPLPLTQFLLPAGFDRATPLHTLHTAALSFPVHSLPLSHHPIFLQMSLPHCSRTSQPFLGAAQSLSTRPLISFLCLKLAPLRSPCHSIIGLDQQSPSGLPNHELAGLSGPQYTAPFLTIHASSTDSVPAS